MRVLRSLTIKGDILRAQVSKSEKPIMIEKMFSLIFIAFCPALCYGVCHFKYAVQPSVYDRDCSPLDLPAMIQCTLDITTDSLTNCTASIMWYFSNDFKSFLNLNYEPHTVEDYTIRTSPCLGKDSMFTITSILNIPAVEPHHYGYYWCITQIENIYNPLHSSVGYLRDGLVTDCHSARNCNQDFIELFQTNRDNVCASLEPPFSPPETESATVANNNCSTTNNTDFTITETATHDTVTSGPKDSGKEQQAQVFIPLAMSLLLMMFIVIFALLIVIAILLYKRRTAHSTTAEPVNATNNLAIDESKNIDMDIESYKNNAYDSINAIREQEANGLTDYVDMHEAVIEKLNNSETNTYQPHSDSNSFEDETYLHMQHIYAHVGELDAIGTLQEPHAKTLT